VRRGVTFLEAILGVVLLGLVTASLASAVAFMSNAQTRLERRLNAAELANRLLLQRIDDDQSLPSQSLPLEYGRDLYHWSMTQERVRFKTRVAGTDTTQGVVGGGVSLDRVQLVTIRVWLAPESGGSRTWDPDVPGIVVTRLIDPMAFANPDSLQTLIEEPGGLERLMNMLMELEQGGGASQ
jgi:type II secretory pathway pseudopilin PulG